MVELGKAVPAANALLKVRSEGFVFLSNLLLYTVFAHFKTSLIPVDIHVLLLNYRKYFKRRKQVSCKFK